MKIINFKKSILALLSLVLLIGLSGQGSNVYATDKILIDENSSFEEVQQVIKPYLINDGNGNVTFDVNKAVEDGQSEFIIESGKLINELNKEYNEEDSSEISSYKLKLPIWGNWCGPGHGYGPTKDLLDKNCMIHDMDYQKYGYFDCGSDIRLIGRIAIDYSKMKLLEKQVATAVTAYFSAQYTYNCS